MTKNRQRVIDHGEVFTPPGLVNDMLDLVQHECERIDSRFLEPACGNGNFLAEVLRRKLATVDRQHAGNEMRWERGAILSVCSLYGIDLLADNVAECRQRLLDVVIAAHEQRFKAAMSAEATRGIEFVLALNIVPGDALSLTFPDGTPIVFSEWSPINGAMIKRRDFIYDHLLDPAELATMPLFSDMGEGVYLPKPICEFTPVHYLKLPDAEVSP